MSAATRYLFADSEPFPYNYDFLATFRGFLDCAARCLEAMTEVERLEAEVLEHIRETTRAVSILEDYAHAVARSADDAMQRSGGAEILSDVAQRVQSFVRRRVKEAQDAHEAEGRRKEAMSRAEMDRFREIARTAVGKFFLEQHLDIVGSRFRLKLSEEGYRMVAICQVPGELEVTYRLAAERLEDWQQPRKVSDFAEDMELQVGMKKKFLKRDLTREIVRIDDMVIASAELDGSRARVHLRKKAESPSDHLVLMMRRDGDELSTEIMRPGEEDDHEPFAAVPSDLRKISKLWRAIEHASRAVLGHRQFVESITIDGEDLFEGNRLVAFVERFVEQYAPVISEISRRSASRKELALKIEREDGRREEIYLRKDDLVDLIGRLDDRKVQMFGKLDVFPEYEVQAV